MRTVVVMGTIATIQVYFLTSGRRAQPVAIHHYPVSVRSTRTGDVVIPIVSVCRHDTIKRCTSVNDSPTRIAVKCLAIR